MFENEIWLSKLNFTQRELIKQSFYLLNWAKKNKTKLFDYSFIITSAAKAYEGFLKDWLFDLKLINKFKHQSDRFRLGKALNPYLENIPHLKKDCLYEEISQKCSKETAKVLWQTWKKCRNRVFHYFLKEQHAFTLEETEEKLNQIIKAIKTADNCLKTSYS